jgi:hypothetical protein
MTTDPNHLLATELRFVSRFEALHLLGHKSTSGSCPSVFGTKGFETGTAKVPTIAHTFDLAPGGP